MCFEGELNCSKGRVLVRLEISDWDFVNYPIVRLLDRLDFVPVVSPHIGASGVLCYFRAGEVVLDRYDPAAAIEQCLNQAHTILDRLVSDQHYREQEFQGEFGATWVWGQAPTPEVILLANLDDGCASASCFQIAEGAAERRYYMVGSNPTEIEALCQTRGWRSSACKVACKIIRTSRFPVLTSTLPATVRGMFDWIRGFDPEAYRALQTLLGEKGYLDQALLLLIVVSPAGPFGFVVPLQELQRRGFLKKPTRYRQFLHRKGGEGNIFRLFAIPIGTDHVHSRNLRFANLKDRHVTVIGCGAIGGYLAQALVKLGAGTGKGNLRLVDPESLSADNLGRHYLGFDSLLKPKSIALREALVRQFPAAQITAFDRATLGAGDLVGDLVINATGEEALSEMLNAARLVLSSDRRPSLLHVWIKGNGECVQTLWVDVPKYACFRCLRQVDAARTERFPVLNAPKETRVRGCLAYTPYAVSAPLAAAALATDAVISWLHGDPSPRFRTRWIEAADIQHIKSKNLDPLAGCPACGK